MDENELLSELRDKRVTKLAEDVDDIKITIGKMSEKLDYVVDGVKDLKRCHDSTQLCVNALQIELASRPKTEELKDAMKRVSTHETYFKLFGVAIGMIVGFIFAMILHVI